MEAMNPYKNKTEQSLMNPQNLLSGRQPDPDPGPDSMNQRHSETHVQSDMQQNSESNIAELHSELTKLQIEVGMVRQMISSLTNAEQDNTEMLQNQSDPDTYDSVANLMPIEQQSVQQLEQMKQIGQELKQHIDQLSSILMKNEDKPAPNETVMSNPGSPALNDPIQQTY